MTSGEEAFGLWAEDQMLKVTCLTRLSKPSEDLTMGRWTREARNMICKSPCIYGTIWMSKARPRSSPQQIRVSLKPSYHIVRRLPLNVISLKLQGLENSSCSSFIRVVGIGHFPSQVHIPMTFKPCSDAAELSSHSFVLKVFRLSQRVQSCQAYSSSL